MADERLQKILARAGIASRRKAETLIASGRVVVNGSVVARLGSKADPARDTILVDGRRVGSGGPPIYLMLNKPAGVITSRFDPEGRPTVHGLIGTLKDKVFSVGRLDYHSEGLLLLTNDGALAQRLMHPSRGVPKTYLVKVKGALTDEGIARLEGGVALDRGVTAPCRVKKVRKMDHNSWIEVTLHEGKKRQIRRMLDRVGHSVMRLVRIRYGPLTLGRPGDLPPGRARLLTPKEVEALRSACHAPTSAARSPRRRSAGRSS